MTQFQDGILENKQFFFRFLNPRESIEKIQQEYFRNECVLWT